MFEGVDDSRLKTLNPFVDDDGVIRLKTKVFNSTDNYNFRCPVVLSPEHKMVKRLIRQRHEDLYHAGVQTTINVIREEYWVLSARRAVRTVIKSCVKCQRYNATKVEVNTPPLPLNRVRDAAIFEVVGVDLAGPLYLQEGQKARGRPSCIYSDQGTNLVGAGNLFKKLDWDKIQERGSAYKIEWRFNPPSAPWWGGFWERLIRLLKQLLRKVLGRISLSYEELITVLIDCEAVINARPITYLSADSNDLAPLTPSMFLQEVPEIGIPDCDYIARKHLCRNLKYRQQLTKDLRQRFRSEYLGSLFYAANSNKATRNLRVGELVLIGDDNQKRADWPLARILELYPGKDGVCRVAKLRTAKGELSRPIQRIYPLEVDLVIGKGESEKEIVRPIKSLESDNKSEPAEDIKVKTRLGRLVKKPNRLNL
ncbi:uncharacterized protein LOC116180668 [Photinus pyralis]|uniref:uncharacterized protein LOC116180668 n=1 Tax=Photinus pyralis TaxID=7054 RepID=UPI0012678327|nr:uncharacterized protein LOC116180668 [Photinus pyralis]